VEISYNSRMGGNGVGITLSWSHTYRVGQSSYTVGYSVVLMVCVPTFGPPYMYAKIVYSCTHMLMSW